MPYIDFSAAAHASFINRFNPDVVFLQELDRRTTRAGGVDQLAVLRESTALEHSHFVKWFNFQGGEYGVAMISRIPLQNAENRSVYKPADWWPWFVVQVVTPVAHAQIEVAGARVQLFATHFPSNDEGRKKFGADELATAIPGAPTSTVFGGDFNDGPGGLAMAAIDAKFIAAESIAAQTVLDDKPVGVASLDDFIDSGLDHIYVSGGVSCDTWMTLFPVESGRQFSDHPICVADLQVPGAPPVPRMLHTSIEPYPAPIAVATTLTVSATDGGSLVAGQVFVDGVFAGSTNAPFSVTLRRRRRRSYNPDRGEWETEVLDPSMSVKAPGYPEAFVDLGF